MEGRGPCQFDSEQTVRLGPKLRREFGVSIADNCLREPVESDYVGHEQRGELRCRSSRSEGY